MLDGGKDKEHEAPALMGLKIAWSRQLGTQLTRTGSDVKCPKGAGTVSTAVLLTFRGSQTQMKVSN